jgi:hypothetical protein
MGPIVGYVRPGGMFIDGLYIDMILKKSGEITKYKLFVGMRKWAVSNIVKQP